MDKKKQQIRNQISNLEIRVKYNILLSYFYIPFEIENITSVQCLQDISLHYLIKTKIINTPTLKIIRKQLTYQYDSAKKIQKILCM